jgi:hypothetical protein
MAFSRPPTFRPQRFSRSRRFTPPVASRVCFAPLPRPGFFLQGVSPSASRSGSSPARPVLSFSGIRLQVSKLSCSSSCRRASTGLILAAGPWLPTGVLRLSVTRSPLEFSIPRVLLRRLLERLHVPSARDLGC